jgi:hypothetical protein
MFGEPDPTVGSKGDGGAGTPRPSFGDLSGDRCGLVFELFVREGRRVWWYSRDNRW